MGESIFDLDDTTGYESPFGNWLPSNEASNSEEEVYITDFVIRATPPHPLSPDKKGKSNSFSAFITVSGTPDKVTVEVKGREVTAYGQALVSGTYQADFESLISAPYQYETLVFTAKVFGLYSKEVTDTKSVTATVDLSGSVIMVNKFNKDEDPKKEKENLDVPDYEVCAIDPEVRSHFVLHCTAGNMSLSSIKKLTKYDDTKGRARSKAHVYLMKDGTTLQIWPFSEKNVWATKTESINKLKGRMFHVEINYGKPDVPTEEQYQGLADLYLEAAGVEKCWPIIVPHIEVDRGIKNGHSDPTDFDYNHFYEILKEKGVPIDDIPKFDHDRYWGKPNYKVPWGSDKNSWPPVLEGNPHKK